MPCVGGRILKLFLGLTLLLGLLTNAALAQVHFVRPGETLSRIARKKIGRPVYGKEKSLEQILKLNPSVKDPNTIRPGQGLRTTLPDPHSPSDPGVIVAAPPIDEVPRRRERPEIQSTLGAVVSNEFRGITCKEQEVGNHAKFYSNASKVSLSWTHQYSPRDFFLTKYGLHYEEFDDQYIADKTLQGKHQVKHLFSLGWAHIFKQSVLSLEMGYEPRLFNRVSSDSIVIDQARSWAVMGGFQRTLVEGHNRNISAHGSLKYILPADGHGYRTKAGVSGKVGALVTLTLREDFISTGGFYYEYTRQNSTLSEQTDIVIGMSIGLGWRY